MEEDRPLEQSELEGQFEPDGSLVDSCGESLSLLRIF